MKKHNFLLSILLLFSAVNFAQVVTVTPRFPKITDSVTVIFNATQGNAGLLNADSVYMHTGVLTAESVNQTDWLHKKAKWGKRDSNVLMQKIGPNLYKKKFLIKTFYGLSTSEKVKELCFVFRNLDGSRVGKNADGSDIFVHVFQQGRFSRFTAPVAFPIYPNPNDHLTFQVTSIGQAMIKLYYDGNLISQANDTILNYNLTVSMTGKHRIWYSAEQNGQTIKDTVYFLVKQTTIFQNPPAGTHDGVNYINDSTVIMQFMAPYKNFVYLIWDKSNWELDPAYFMNKTSDGKRFWIKLTGLTPMKEYRYQYLVDNSINIADPYSEKLLDRFNDGGINPLIYPGLIAYPINKTSEMVGVFQTGQTAYLWTDQTFQKPDTRDLVIYELLVRDWHIRHNYQTVLDSISYFKRLGINAIELMPVMEYDGNDSWGYMPAFHFAPDKCYGTKTMLKHFVDVCHKNGIAVILDIVLNHASGQNPMARLYFDKEKGRPTSNNPWFNELIPHPFGYNSDFNHAKPETQAYVDSVLNFWSTEYHTDGFRFDLSKGFTNRVSVTYDANGDINSTDLGAWQNYDADRVWYLTRMADKIWSKHPGLYLILEHFASNDEDGYLASYGFLLWCSAQANNAYGQAAMGWNNDADFEWSVSYKARQWVYHNLVGYNESHDEERLMFKNYSWGNMNVPNGDTIYSTRDTLVALDRIAQANAFLFTVPGPKMFWQFGERGFDYSINWPSMTGETRTNSKPPKWEYMKDPNRLKLFKKFAALIKLKTQNQIFRTSDYIMNTGNYDKRIRLWDNTATGPQAAVVLGNFNVAEQSVWPEFSKAGKWYDYFSGDSLTITSTQTENQNFTLQYQPGEFHIYTDVRIPKPDLYVDTTHHGIFVPEITSMKNFKSYVYPNPFNNEMTINYSLEKGDYISVKIYDILGNEIISLCNSYQDAGLHFLRWNGKSENGNQVKAGYYYYKITSSSKTESSKILFSGKK